MGLFTSLATVQDLYLLRYLEYFYNMDLLLLLIGYYHYCIGH